MSTIRNELSVNILLAAGRQPGTFSENSYGKSYTQIWILKGEAPLPGEFSQKVTGCLPVASRRCPTEQTTRKKCCSNLTFFLIRVNDLIVSDQKFRRKKKHTNLNLLASCRRIWTKICQNEALAIPCFSIRFLQITSKEEQGSILEDKFGQKTTFPKHTHLYSVGVLLSSK